MLHIKFQTSEHSGSEEEEEEDFLNIFLCIFMVRTLDSQVRGHLGPRDLCLNKLGKGSLDNAILRTKFQASEQSGCEEAI